MLNFIAKKSKFLFKDISNANKMTNVNELIDEGLNFYLFCFLLKFFDSLILEVYPMLPPIEKFMHIPALQAKTHFFKFDLSDTVFFLLLFLISIYLHKSQNIYKIIYIYNNNICKKLFFSIFR
jgi:hypothetical protein